MRRHISGEERVTQRQGDVYFGYVLRPLPKIDPIYQRFIPEDYESRIPEEERIEEFLSIGNPDSFGHITLSGKKGRIMQFLLRHVGQTFSKKDISEGIGVEVGDAILGLNGFRNSQCFEIVKTSNNGKSHYTLEEKEPSPEHLRELEKLDVKFGLALPRDSLDSSML